ncbi:DUF1203 domain-containing protein [Stenotrophomonas sp. PS02298]|uniref:DUF1203 domain-containing protein n=1 Tax=Stenotrophomonas sp. PS02298 TaxID=2991424 RepID=UPI00249BD027|nr:DUF1203 domain-containing protein [Stenotrophomonas sp. PS02298]
MSSFLLSGLSPALFVELFQLDDAALDARHITRVTATEASGFPCRVSLADATVGEELLLLSFQHQPADSPYRASGPIFVRRGVARAELQVNEVPSQVQRRLMSLRAYSVEDRITFAEVCDGRDVGEWLQDVFEDAAVAYVHLHFARYGCFACRADRVS